MLYRFVVKFSRILLTTQHTGVIVGGSIGVKRSRTPLDLIAFIGSRSSAVSCRVRRCLPVDRRMRHQITDLAARSFW